MPVRRGSRRAIRGIRAGTEAVFRLAAERARVRVPAVLVRRGERVRRLGKLAVASGALILGGCASSAEYEKLVKEHDALLQRQAGQEKRSTELERRIGELEERIARTEGRFPMDVQKAVENMLGYSHGRLSMGTIGEELKAANKTVSLFIAALKNTEAGRALTGDQKNQLRSRLDSARKVVEWAKAAFKYETLEKNVETSAEELDKIIGDARKLLE